MFISEKKAVWKAIQIKTILGHVTWTWIRNAAMFLPIVFWHAVPVRSKPFEVTDQSWILNLSLASEEEISAHWHVVWSSWDYLQGIVATLTLTLATDQSAARTRGKNCIVGERERKKRKQINIWFFSSKKKREREKNKILGNTHGLECERASERADMKSFSLLVSGHWFLLHYRKLCLGSKCWE